MENYFLAEILRREILQIATEKPPEPKSQLLKEECVSLEETNDWRKDQYRLFTDDMQDNGFIPGMQLGYASSCTTISFKFFEGPNVQLELKCTSKLAEFGEKYFEPKIKTQDRRVTPQKFEVSFCDKYTYRIDGRENMLHVGQMVAVITDEDGETLWNRAIIEPCEFFNDDRSYCQRRTRPPPVEFKEKRRSKKGKTRSEEEDTRLRYKDQVNVYFIDYGYSASAFIGNIRFIDKIFLQVKMQYHTGHQPIFSTLHLH